MEHPYLVGTIALVLAVIIFGIVKLCLWIGRTQEHKTNIWKAVDDVRDDLIRLISKPAVNGSSPLHLTKIGKEISSMIDARQWAEELAGELEPEAKGKRPFEIQELSSHHVFYEMKMTPEQKARVGQCAYEKGIPKSVILDALMVELRDALFRLEDAPLNVSGGGDV